METTISVTEENIVLMNEQPEFVVGDEEKVSARYFVICEKTTGQDLPKNVCDCVVAGLSLAEWVSRACPESPTIINIAEGEDAVEAVRPYATGAEYAVILFASTPLLVQGHINDMLGFVNRKHLSACKLKKGYIFRNDYLRRSGEIYSIDTYDFSSMDFFEVNNCADLGRAARHLLKRLQDYHTKNQVELRGVNIGLDASVEIGFGTTICSGASVTLGSIVGSGVYIGSNAVLENCKVANDVTIGNGAVIRGSVIKSGAKIEDGAILSSSVVGERSIIGAGSRLTKSGLKSNVIVGSGANLLGARVSDDVVIGEGASIITEEENSLVLSGACIGAGAVVVDSTVSANSKVQPLSRIYRSEER